jgi:hypothetical protein
LPAEELDKECMNLPHSPQIDIYKKEYVRISSRQAVHGSIVGKARQGTIEKKSEARTRIQEIDS